MTAASVRALLATTLVASLGCLEASAPQVGGTMSASAREYLTVALDTMQKVSIRRDVADWAGIRRAAFLAATGAQRDADTHAAIEQALRAIGDNHSFLIRPVPAAAVAASNAAGPPPWPTGAALSDRVAYLVLPGMSGTSADALAYADSLSALVRTLSAGAPCGWIVDLRSNPGGNMYPMLAGLTAFFRDETLGYFVDADQRRTAWWSRGGSIGLTSPEGVVARVLGARNAVAPFGSQPPVAVIAGRSTAKLGEIVVVSFIGRADTRRFGHPTRGLSTANSGVRLRDGAVMQITVAIDADRAGRLYGGAIDPDEPVAAASDVAAAQDPGTSTATAWLLAQPACALR